MKVKIKKHQYKIIECGKDDELFYKDNELLRYGQCDYVNQTIKIFKDSPYPRKRETLIHELTHAFLNSYLESFQIKDKYDQEDICCFVSSYSEEIIEITNKYFKKKEKWQ